MNFHIPCDNKGLNRYVKYLKKFHYHNVPSLHMKAWCALTFLESNYHVTAGRTGEYVMEFCKGLQTL
jgi:hypothetical protein